MSYIFITHDVQAATYLCDHLIIFKDGRIELQTATSNLYRQHNSHTKELIDKQLSF
ncbi:nickel transport ATP-binding protein [Staphylococcus saccharolyticus]|uniref:Nickel transport ATP-binding protein n=1 Tax=Staphylococcus saccharolyticus TaxID=33028 RepID=A0A380GZ39_9STAP|nr:nickel transport ATP-binding protein [Staphylococcus saccharolyticus]